MPKAAPSAYPGECQAFRGKTSSCFLQRDPKAVSTVSRRWACHSKRVQTGCQVRLRQAMERAVPLHCRVQTDRGTPPYATSTWHLKRKKSFFLNSGANLTLEEKDELLEQPCQPDTWREGWAPWTAAPTWHLKRRMSSLNSGANLTLEEKDELLEQRRQPDTWREGWAPWTAAPTWHLKRRMSSLNSSTNLTLEEKDELLEQQRQPDTWREGWAPWTAAPTWDLKRRMSSSWNCSATWAALGGKTTSTAPGDDGRRQGCGSAAGFPEAPACSSQLRGFRNALLLRMSWHRDGTAESSELTVSGCRSRWTSWSTRQFAASREAMLSYPTYTTFLFINTNHPHVCNNAYVCPCVCV